MGYQKKERPQLTETICACGCGQRLLDFEDMMGRYKVGHHLKQQRERKDNMKIILNGKKKP